MDLATLEEDFQFLDDWTDRYRYLIELGEKLPPLPAEAHTEENRVRGCMSQVWLKTEIEPGPPARISFVGDSDSAIVKGLVALLTAAYSNQTAEHIIDFDLRGAFERLGLENNISPNRRNGFFSMVEKIRRLASEHV